MTSNNAYERGYRQFIYHLAEDAITRYLDDKPNTAAFIAEAVENYQRAVTALVEADNYDVMDGWLDYLTSIANTLADKVKNASPENRDDFAGDNYKILICAAYDTIGIEH